MPLYPMTTIGDLRNAIQGLRDHTPLYLRDADGKSLLLYGVAPVLNDQEEHIGFVLQVGPKEKADL